MIKHATYTVSLANHYKNGKIPWAREGPWTFPLTRLEQKKPGDSCAEKKSTQQLLVTAHLRVQTRKYGCNLGRQILLPWKNKSIVFVGSCHQLQSRRKLSFGLQEDLKILPICTWSKSGARMEHHISVDFFRSSDAKWLKPTISWMIFFASQSTASLSF